MNITKMLNRPVKIDDGYDDATAEENFFGDAMHDALAHGDDAPPLGEDAWFEEGGAPSIGSASDTATPDRHLDSIDLEATFFGPGDSLDGPSPFDMSHNEREAAKLATASVTISSVPLAVNETAPPFDPADFDDDVHLMMMSSLGSVLPPPPKTPAPAGAALEQPARITGRKGAHRLTAHPLEAHALGAPFSERGDAGHPSALDTALAAPLMPVARGRRDATDAESDGTDAATFEDGEPTREIRPLKTARAMADARANVERQIFDAAVKLSLDGSDEPATQSYDVDMLKEDDGSAPARRSTPEFLFANEAPQVSIPRALSSGELVAATEIARVLEASMLDLAATTAIDDALADISVAMNKERATIRVGGQNGDAAVELEVRVDGDKVFLTTDPNGLATLNPRRHELVAALADAGFTFSGFSDAEDTHEGHAQRDPDDGRQTPSPENKSNRAPVPVARSATNRARSVLA